MTAVFIVPALVCILGLAVWVLVSRKAMIPHAAAICFAAGLLVWLTVIAHEVVKL